MHDKDDLTAIAEAVGVYQPPRHDMHGYAIAVFLGICMWTPCIIYTAITGA